MPATGKPTGANPKRLLKRAEFLAVRRGEKRRGRLLLVEVLDRGDSEAPRVGYTVTKKVGNAVERNRVRRRLREMVRLRAAPAAEAGRDYVLIGRRTALKAPFERMVAEFAGALKRVGKKRARSAAESTT